MCTDSRASVFLVSLPEHACGCKKEEARGVRAINLHLVIYEGVRLSGIQRRLAQLILPCCGCGVGVDIGVSCHLPTLLVALSHSACCRQQPRGIAEREMEDEVRKEASRD